VLEEGELLPQPTEEADVASADRVGSLNRRLIAQTAEARQGPADDLRILVTDPDNSIATSLCIEDAGEKSA
jgi:hypothetical protein